MQYRIRIALVAAAAGLLLHSAAAQSPPPGVPGPNDTWKLPNREAMNAGTVTLITAPAGGATSIFGSDMARVLDDNNVRVLTVLGKGPVHNVVDVLYLKAIDMGIVVADVPEFYRLQYKVTGHHLTVALHRQALQQRDPCRCADFGQIDIRSGGQADRRLDRRRLLRRQGDFQSA